MAEQDNCYYHAPLDVFFEDEDRLIVEILKKNDCGPSSEQIRAWKDTVSILKDQLSGYDSGEIALEYTIPRIGRRIDAVFFYRNIVFVIEFKCGMKKYCAETYEQVINYAYDLHFFHESSKNRLLVPIELPTDAPNVPFEIEEDDGILYPIPCNRSNLRKVIDAVCDKYCDEGELDVEEWLQSQYRLTPTIIEAAQELYREHTVENIKRNDSTNLTETLQTLNRVIEDCKVNKRKAICFVTGVPGAGKTLVGLSLAIQNSDKDKEEHSVYLSGNGPLVETLKEALIRDMVKYHGMPKYKATLAVKSFIQSIYNFRRDGILNPDKVPNEHVAIFDEAQRAWTEKKLHNFTAYRMGKQYYHSEPESLISDMDRHKDWATIVCLVGGGQEIYDGEAGISEWFDALRSIPGWEVYVTPQLNDAEYVRGTTWSEMTRDLEIHADPSLHLSVSMRSLRTDMLNSFVKAVLDRDDIAAKRCYEELGQRYPIVLTRNLETAKKWVAEMSAPNERYGMVESSHTVRILNNGLEDRPAVARWLLDEKYEKTSSYQLSKAASEFDIQGLELDYVLVHWGPDLRVESDAWHYYKVGKGSKAALKDLGNVDHYSDGSENLTFDQLYLKNTYRVLMTRARKGMVIYVPCGDVNNFCSLPDYYAGIYRYFKRIGIRELF